MVNTKEDEISIHKQNTPLCNHSVNKENGIREAGAASLSYLLKSNTTLTEVDLSGEDKRKKTHRWHQQVTLFLSLHTNRESHWKKWSSIIE